MCSSHSVLGLCLGAALRVCIFLAYPAWAADYPGIGRLATPAEIKAWDKDIRPDLLGLPAGSGSVEAGSTLYREQCASCHGSGGDSAALFIPLIGGTDAHDIATGRVAALVHSKNYRGPPTTFMKLSSLSTLFDYIQRAMPWFAPGSLTPDEVYALVAYLLYLADVVPASFILSEENFQTTNARLPNRKGMTTYHHLWITTLACTRQPGEAPAADTQNSRCMSDCALPAETVPVSPALHKAQGDLRKQFRNWRPFGTAVEVQ